MSIESFPSPLVSTAWLSSHLTTPSVKVVDASTYLPNAGRNARAEYLAGHIPGAVFGDLDWLSDQTAPLPHTLPGAEAFAERIGSLGIGTGDSIVVYDGSRQNFSAPRLWFMLRIFGHQRVSVLDGGLHRWAQDGYLIETTVPTVTQAVFEARLDATRVRTLDDMRANLASHGEQVVDARSPGRFAATEPEPRAGVRGGHIPGSVSLHYARLVREDGTLRSAGELRTIIAAAGIDLAQPIVASCGTGVTACAVVLALDVLGVSNAAVYDGSWTEWGGRDDTAVETGAGRGA